MKVLIALVLPILVTGWDTDGHWIIALIAGRFINTKTENFLRSFLDIRTDTISKGLAYHAIWADLMTQKKAYEWTKPLHFAYSDSKCSPFDLQQDCDDGVCIACEG